LLPFAFDLRQTKFKNRTLDIVTITAHISDKGSLNITITTNNIHMLRRIGNLYPRAKNNLDGQFCSTDLVSSENRRDDSIPTIIRKVKDTQEINVATVD
jgi:hypothetical protein